jgi:nucleoporin SEH1
MFFVLPPEVVNPGEDRARGRWQRKAQLCDSKKSVNDVQFAPRHLGLRLAAASSDGIVRIYEASDVFSLNYWPLQVELSFLSI